jgi:phenylacetate-CoA ligase
MDASRGKRVAAGLADFCARAPVSGGQEGWPLELFRRVAGSVPAYRDFLREHGVVPAGVGTLGDFGRLPLMTKENYHTRYPLAQRCREGRLEGCDVIAVSSGSTGDLRTGRGS